MAAAWRRIWWATGPASVSDVSPVRTARPAVARSRPRVDPSHLPSRRQVRRHGSSRRTPAGAARVGGWAWKRRGGRARDLGYRDTVVCGPPRNARHHCWLRRGADRRCGGPSGATTTWSRPNRLPTHRCSAPGARHCVWVRTRPGRRTLARRGPCDPPTPHHDDNGAAPLVSQRDACRPPSTSGHRRASADPTARRQRRDRHEGPSERW